MSSIYTFLWFLCFVSGLFPPFLSVSISFFFNPPILSPYFFLPFPTQSFPPYLSLTSVIFLHISLSFHLSVSVFLYPLFLLFIRPSLSLFLPVSLSFFFFQPQSHLLLSAHNISGSNFRQSIPIDILARHLSALPLS
jgi:hypothetical protein